MSKVALLLSVLAAAAAAFALLQGRGAPPAAREPVADLRIEAISRDVRTLARKETDARLSEVLTTEVDKRIQRLEQIRKGLEASVAEARRLAEASADSVAARVDQVEQSGRRAVKAVEEQLEALRGAVGEIRDRPAAPEPARPTPSPKEPETAPTPGEPAGPEVPPATPAAPAMSEAEKQEIAKAMADLDASDLAKLSPAIETVRKRKVKEATPKLVKILATHKEAFARMAAATALGGIGMADAMDGLIEALVDEESMVATQASKAIRQISGHDLDISAKAGIRERRKAKSEMRQWWKEHEEEVRGRLGQPKASAPGEGS